MSENWPKRIAEGWHPVAEVGALGTKPLATRLMGTPLVVFGAAGTPVVMIDRCPHRSIPLSGGRIVGDTIACPYHGWRFGADGACVEVPGSNCVPDAPAKVLPMVERLGLVWTSLAAVPPAFPALPPEPEDPALDHFTWAVPATTIRLLDAIENMLDASHPHFVHPFFLRHTRARRRVAVDIRVHPDGAEAIYHENAPAGGFMPRLLEGARTTAAGRYFAPTISQLEFRTRRGLSVSLVVFFTPEDVDLTRPYAWFSTQRRIAPNWLKKFVLKEFNRPLLKQDQDVLEKQVQTLRTQGGKVDFKVGPLDFLGPSIWKIANGATVAEERREAEIWL